ncbi:MAG: dTMP kinase [Robiginitomaculum sp.]|nr:MAG: dTMP kinase [Robiginitomaculum sp.]
MTKGGAKFISFEGGEGAGKTTQIKFLGEILRHAGHEVVITREPGGTPDAEAVRDLVLGGEPGRWSAKEEMLLMYTARSQLVRTIIRPALERGAWVLSDRFADSTLVYQGYAGGVDPDEVRKLHDLVLGPFNPDITFIMDIDPNSGMQRVHARAEALNQFEKRKSNFYEMTRNAYLDIAKSEPNRCAVINAAQDATKVSMDIVQVIKDRLGIAL